MNPKKKNLKKNPKKATAPLTGEPAAPALNAGPAVAPQEPVIEPKDNAGQAKKLEEVGAVIARENSLAEKEAADKKLQEDQKLTPQPGPSHIPAPGSGFSFELTPACKKVGAGVSFYVLTWIVETFFKRGIKPLTDKQQAEIEAAIDRLAQKFMPLFMQKFMSEHREESDLAFVLAGIGFENNIPLAPKQAQPGPVDRPPTIPESPQANITVITAEAPPLPGA